MKVDYTSRPVGSWFGGKDPRTRECPVCKRPGVIHRKGVEQGKPYTEYVHGCTISLNSKNEPVIAWDEPHRHFT